MLQIEFDKAKWIEDSDGLHLTLKVLPEYRSSVKQFCLDVNSVYTAKLSRYRPRSLNANAYFWVLADRLAEKTRIPKEEIYKNIVRDIGGNSETICVQNKAVSRICEGWAHNGLGWVTDTLPSKIDGCTNVILYYGSSTYDSEQMSRLIDLIVQECEEQGIDTKTPEELARLKEEWD